MQSCTTTPKTLIVSIIHNMPRKYMKKRPAARRPRRARKGAPVALPKRTTGNFASATETFSVAVTAGIVNDFTLDMTDLVRTQALMSVYQYYRITSVEMRFKPQVDTFPTGQANTLPYLYFQYDKSGSLTGLNAQGFEELGTKAIRFDDKTLVRKWKPSVVTSGPTAGAAVATTQFKVSPWLPTQISGVLNNKVTHYGSIFYISKAAPSDGTIYDVDVIVNVQYRKPQITASTGEANPNPPRIRQGNTTAVDLSLNPHLLVSNA